MNISRLQVCRLGRVHVDRRTPLNGYSNFKCPKIWRRSYVIFWFVKYSCSKKILDFFMKHDKNPHSNINRASSWDQLYANGSKRVATMLSTERNGIVKTNPVLMNTILCVKFGRIGTDFIAFTFILEWCNWQLALRWFSALKDRNKLQDLDDIICAEKWHTLSFGTMSAEPRLHWCACTIIMSNNKTNTFECCW